MATQTNELLVWQDGAPVINMAPNKEFDIWQDSAPLVDIDESNGGVTPVVTIIRRRSFIF